MTFKNIILLISFITIILSSCTTMYIPTLPNTPLFKNKNEFQSEANINPDGINCKMAFSPIKHLGITVNGQYFYNSKFLFGSTYNDYHEYIDGSLGFYSSIKNKLLYEFYLGYGIGQSRMHYSLDEWDNYLFSYNKGLYNKMYGQINIALESKSGNLFGLTNRYGYMNYKLDESAFRWLGTKNIQHTIWEPSLLYIKKISNKFYLSSYAGVVFVSDNPDIHGNPTVFYNKISAGIGIKLVLGRNENK